MCILQTPVKHQIIITYIHLDSIKCALCYAIQRKLKIYVLLLQISRWQCAVFMTVLSENLSLKTNIIFYRNNKKAAHYFLSFIVKCILQQLWTDTCKENSRLNKNKRRTTKKKNIVLFLTTLPADRKHIAFCITGSFTVTIILLKSIVEKVF